MDRLNYVVTAYKPTIVTHTCVGNFTSDAYYNIIVAKHTRLEIYKIIRDGIELMGDSPIYGRIASLELFHPQDEPLGLLFILTEKHNTCVLRWDAMACELITRSVSMDVSDRDGKRPSNNQICTVDPDYRLIGLFLYDGTCKVVPLDNSGQLKKSFNIRLESLQVKDIKFLYGCAKPTVAVLYQDKTYEGACHAKTYEVSIENEYCGTGPWSQDNLDNAADLLIPVPTPLCGVLIIGEERFVYCSANTSKEISKTRSTTKAYGRVDDFRYLLGDCKGLLHLLVVTHENQRVTGLTFELLGETSIASTISYLENSLVFVGSSCGDSQLIKVDLDAKGSGVQVLKKFVNLGPISDLCVVDLERNGKAQVVTCSGASKDCSLRIVCKGIIEQASLELQGIKGMWSLKSSIDEAFDTYLVVSFISETRILAMNLKDELEEIEIEGFLSEVQTLFCHDAVYNQLVQVTSNSVRLVSSTTGKLLSNWDSSGGLTVNIATGNASQVLLASEDRHLLYFEVGDGILTEVKRTQLDYTASCLNINPIGANPNFSELASVGKWTDVSVEIRKLPGLTLVTKRQIRGKIVPRSVLLCAFEGTSYLLCGLGDGNLMIFQLDKNTGDIVDTKEISLGTQPITLHTFSLKSAEYVFAASNRPTVIYSSNNKLLYNDLDLEDVSHVCQFNFATCPDSIAIATRDKLTIGNIDATQKLNVRTIPLGEYACCICHQAQTCTYGICSNDSGIHVVRLLEDQTFNVLSAYTLGSSEHGLSIVSCLFSGDTNEYYCVGTKYVLPDEEDTEYVSDEEDITKGRILVFKVEKEELRLIAKLETKEAVSSVNAFKGKLLAAMSGAFSGNIVLYNWMLQSSEVHELELECRHYWFMSETLLEVVDIQAREDFIVVCDIIGSISVFFYKTGALEEQGRFFEEESYSMAAVQILDDNVYLGADNCYNLYTMKKNDEEEGELALACQYHLGETVNKFCHGSFGRGLRDSENGRVPTIIFGTTSGMIGVIASLPPKQYAFLQMMELRMRMRINGVGGLSHMMWRSFCYNKKQKVMSAKNFVDGDLIESFLDLSQEKKKDISEDMGVPLEELCKTVEELNRLH